MKKILSSSLVLAASLSLSLAFASAAQAAPETPVAATGAVQVKGAASYEPTQQDREAIIGAYKLETGEIVRISENNLHYYSETKGRMPVEIYPRAPGVFVSAEGVKLTFDDSGDKITVRQPERQLAAAR